MTTKRPVISFTRLVFGLAVIVFGAVLTLQNLEIVDAEELIPYWPVLLIAVGIAGAFNRTYSGFVFAAFMVGFGAWLLAFNLGYVAEEPWDYFWPMVLIILGVNLVLGGLRKGPFRNRKGDRLEGLYTSAFAFMSGQELQNSSDDFRGADLTAIMGGLDLDLTKAQVAEDVPVIRTFAFWGGVDVKVPPEWRVQSRVLPLMGAYEDTTESSDSEGPVVLIKGAAIMGGVGISN